MSYNDETEMNNYGTRFDEPEEAAAEQLEIKAKKKKLFIQIPVLIALGIVVLSVVGYFAYTFFFLREPAGVTWEATYDEVPYYFEFDNEGNAKGFVGSVEVTGNYEKYMSEGQKNIIVNMEIGEFYPGNAATYEITGSRILNNQKFKISYDDEHQFTLSQSKGREYPLELPVDFKPDENLLGSWKFSYYGYDYCTVTFNNDGSMKIDYTSQGVAYNGVYTIENGVVNFTYYVNESLVQPLEYKVKGDVLEFMGMQLVRVGSDATVDELQTPTD